MLNRTSIRDISFEFQNPTNHVTAVANEMRFHKKRRHTHRSEDPSETATQLESQQEFLNAYNERRRQLRREIANSAGPRRVSAERMLAALDRLQAKRT